jgi:hypothetical protein
MIEKKSIFKSLSSLPIQEWQCTSIQKILETIPKESYIKQNKELEKLYTEWRWRFIEMEKNNFCEISYKKPTNSSRFFINKKGKWIEQTIDPEFDKYVIKTIFYYN